MARTPCCDKSGMRKGTWTSEEDRKLTAYVTRYGCWNWRQLPKYAGLPRCGKSCRLRWMNYLRPNLKRGRYSKEEDELIIKMHESLGNRWSAIAAHFPGRTDSDIKNHWHTSLTKASKQGSNAKMSRRSKNPSRRNRGRRMENHENSPVNPPTQEILESSEFSTHPSTSSSATSSENCSSSPASSNSVATEFRTVVGESDDFMAEIVGGPIGSFWTEPFLTDNYSTINYPPPFAAEVLLSSYDYFDGNVMNTLIW